MHKFIEISGVEYLFEADKTIPIGSTDTSYNYSLIRRTVDPAKKLAAGFWDWYDAGPDTIFRAVPCFVTNYQFGSRGARYPEYLHSVVLVCSAVDSSYNHVKLTSHRYDAADPIFIKPKDRRMYCRELTAEEDYDAALKEMGKWCKENVGLKGWQLCIATPIDHTLYFDQDVEFVPGQGRNVGLLLLLTFDDQVDASALVPFALTWVD